MIGKQLISLFAAGALILSSCDEQELIQGALEKEEYNTVTMHPVGGMESLMIVASSNWTIFAPEWITCTPKEGKKGISEVTISADVNRTRIDRSGIILVKCNNAEDNQEIAVSQQAPYLKVDLLDAEGNIISNEEIGFEWNSSKGSGKGSIFLRIASNIDWRLSLEQVEGADNFRLSTLSGSGDSRVELYADKNNLDRTRYVSSLNAFGTTSKDGNERVGEGVDEFSWPLIHDNFVFLINDSYEDVTVSIDELNQIINNGALSIETELPWRIGSTGWVSVDKKSGSEGISNIEIKADGVNPSREQRTYDVKILSDSGAERTVTVIQDPYILSVDKKNLIFNNEGKQEQTIIISSSSNWEISSSLPPWLSVDPVSGSGSATIKVSCNSQNLNLSDNDYPLVFSSLQNSLSESSLIKQDRFIFEVAADENLSKIPNQSTQQYNVGIVSSGPWSIEPVSTIDWISISKESGTGSETISVGANSVNPSEEYDRSVKLRLISEAHKSAGQDIH